jgi:hypothetical protein
MRGKLKQFRVNAGITLRDGGKPAPPFATCLGFSTTRRAELALGTCAVDCDIEPAEPIAAGRAS